MDQRVPLRATPAQRRAHIELAVPMMHERETRSPAESEPTARFESGKRYRTVLLKVDSSAPSAALLKIRLVAGPMANTGATTCRCAPNGRTYPHSRVVECP